VPFDDQGDRVLLGRSGAGDAAAFEELYRRYGRPVGALLYRMCWDRATAEDCLQEVFLRLWRAARDFRGDCAVSTFIFRIARNVWLNVRDSRSHREGSPVLATANEEPLGRTESGSPPRAERIAPQAERPEHKLDAAETAAAIRRSVGLLDDDHRMVFVLAHYEGLRYREISNVLEIPVGTVKSRMAVAERRLREALAPYLDMPGGGEP
jgi:RNA polymerase sigma-70 factor (ECF subfamily)